MKRILFSALLAGLTLAVGAQNGEKKAQEEKESAKQELEMIYLLRTGKIFDGWEESKPEEVKTFPWDQWVEKQKNDYKKFSYIIRGFDNYPSVEDCEDNPKACQIFIDCPIKSGRTSSTTSFLEMQKNNFHVDRGGNLTGVLVKIDDFCDLIADIKLSLITKKGKPVFISANGESLVLRGEKKKEYDQFQTRFGIQLPLTCPLSEVSDGHIDVRLYTSEEYNRVEIPVASVKNGPKRLTLGGATFNVEKIDSIGFVISADRETIKRLKKMSYLYRVGDSWFKPTSSSSFTGNLKTMLKYNGKEEDISFEQWLKEMGINLDNLDSTMGNIKKMMKEEEGIGATNWGKRFNSGMTGDVLVLYMPSNPKPKKLIASARIYPAPILTKSFLGGFVQPAETTINRELYMDLLAKLYRAYIGDANASLPKSLYEESEY